MLRYLSQISSVMDKFEGQFEDLDIHTQYMEGAMGEATTLTTPQDEVETLMQQVAEEHGLELGAEMGQAPSGLIGTAEESTSNKEEDMLNERLRQLRG